MARAATLDTGTDTRERILVAALQAFAEKGFEGATTREIASRAGVNLGLLQYHFGAKPKLWRAAVDRAFEELRSVLETVLAEPGAVDERERMRRLLRGFVHFVAAHPEFVRLMHDEGKRRGPRMRWIVDRHVRPLYEVTGTLLRRAQERGLLPGGVDPIHFHYVLAGSVGLIFHQAEECKRLAGFDPADPAVVESHARVVEHLFLGPASEETQR